MPQVPPGAQFELLLAVGPLAPREFAANIEIFFCVLTLPQLGQTTSCAPTIRTNFSKFSLHS
jgi:hypothetical protein